MKFPFLASFILFCIFFNWRAGRVKKKFDEKEENFWDRERRSNSVRKKSLENLEYIHIPIDLLPFDTYGDNPVLKGAEEEVLALKDEKIVNFTGISNTDLKLEYGTANITALTQYDMNYTSLVVSLQKWGQELYNQCRYEDAANVLEFAVKTRTDISSTYRLLVDMYKTKLEMTSSEITHKLEALLPIANELNSLSRNQIVKMIEEALPQETSA
ncbi:hypothetical protein [Butyrivibrio sp. INlla14]|uniref:hypothetical protein n=1 Tax=Butyrivibrio sp. INlla14 TaxID=1520808 RepID=UPI000876DEAC|nr:hypothetical protein [Butyrivibrio sp. INlla14]SCY71944.1 hypothetical protein SAMN02910371_03567 [Butyrivibrio sp. INlla14]